MIIFRDVTKKYGAGEPVLAGVNFKIEKGHFAYLIGPTGSGKTTIFRLIINDLSPTEGEIILDEWNLSKLSKSKVPELRRKVGVVFQDLKLLNDRTVLENIILPLDFTNTSEKEARRLAEEILKEVGLAGKEDMFPAQLSGGERQRVAIARALVFNPEIILADEPTGNLDSKTSFQILDILKGINKRGTTIFMATHNDKLISSDDRVIVLENGKIIEDRVKHVKENFENKSKEVDKNKDAGHEKHEKIKLETLAEKTKQ